VLALVPVLGALLLGSGALATALLAADEEGALDLVPGNAQVLVDVRVGDILKTDLGKQALENLKAGPKNPLEELTKATGLELTDLEQVTFAGVDMDKKDGWAIVRFNKAVDKKKLYSHPKITRKEATHEGKAYDQIVVDKETLGVYWVNDKMAVVGNEEPVKKCMTMLASKRPTGPMDEALKRAREKHSIVIGVVPPPEAKKRPPRPGKPPGGTDPGEVLKDLDIATIVIDYDNHTKVEAVGRMATDTAAEKLKDAIDKGLDKVKQQLEGLRAFAPLMLPKSPAITPQRIDSVFKVAKEVLASVKVSQADTVVTVRASINVKALAEAVGPIVEEAIKNMDKSGTRPIRPGGDTALPGRLPFGASQATHVNNLKQITLAMINYADANGGKLPPAVICDAAGKPLYSWRVELLPYLEQQELYKQFHKDEPWDSEANEKVLAKMPSTFALPGSPAGETKTCYQVFVGPDTPYPGDGHKGLRFPAGFPDGTSNTILVAEADKLVEWTKPDDMRLKAGVTVKSLLGHRVDSKKFYVALADGSTKALPLTISEETLKNAVNPADGQPLGSDWP
jgi:hypothetical protein